MPAVATAPRPAAALVASSIPVTPGKPPESGRLTVKLGDTAVPVVFVRNGPGNVFLNLHQDEVTSRRVGEAHVRQVGGAFLGFDTGVASRHLKLTLDGRTYTVDPNRMFDARGLLRSTQAMSPRPTKAVAERLAADARAFLKTVVVPELERAEAKALVALHNNHDGGALSLGGLDGDATVLALHRAARGGDADDFVLTPHQQLFEHVRGSDAVHAVREKEGLAETAEGDGSLSQYWQGANAIVGGRVIAYANSEAQHEHSAAQHRQLELVQTFAGASRFAPPPVAPKPTAPKPLAPRPTGSTPPRPSHVTASLSAPRPAVAAPA